MITIEDESTNPEVHRVVLYEKRSLIIGEDKSTDPEVHRVSII